MLSFRARSCSWRVTKVILTTKRNDFCFSTSLLIMNDLVKIHITPLGDSQYVKPIKMHYVQNGVPKTWDMVKEHRSVSILIFNTSRKVLLFVKQFRPAVYYASIPEEDRCDSVDTEKYPAERGITLELCAGIVDKDKPLVEIAREEVLEECGYDVPVVNLQQVISFRSSVGISGSIQTLYYAEVEDSMRVGDGGGNLEEGEFIEVVELSIADAKKYLESGDVMSPPGFCFALLWFFQTKDAL